PPTTSPACGWSCAFSPACSLPSALPLACGCTFSPAASDPLRLRPRAAFSLEPLTEMRCDRSCLAEAFRALTARTSPLAGTAIDAAATHVAEPSTAAQSFEPCLIALPPVLADPCHSSFEMGQFPATNARAVLGHLPR